MAARMDWVNRSASQSISSLVAGLVSIIMGIENASDDSTVVEIRALRRPPCLAEFLQTVLKRGLRRRWQYQSANKMSW